MENKTYINRAWWFMVLAVLAFGLVLRTSGLFRGLEEGYCFHPDAPKQVAALGNFLEGRYVWYVGSLFYDGYPLGLNHVDEWILRPVLAIHHGVRGYLFPDSANPPLPDRAMLYYWARSLRVLYGMICLGLSLLIARSVLVGRGGALAVLSLAALAPLSVVVTHAATGDIGVDMFTLAAMMSLCLYAGRARLSWIALTGVAIGLAFSVKYQGALAGLPLLFFMLFKFRPAGFVRNTLLPGLVAAAGFAGGVLLGTPSFLVNGQRTWRDIRSNFEFIRNYNISEEFLSKTPVGKVVYCLVENIPKVMGALGWILTFLAFAGLIRAGLQLREALRRHAPDSVERHQAILVFSLFAFPFAAIFVSLLGKPEVQPFHFAYLQVPLILAAVYALKALWACPGLFRTAAAILFLSALLEFGVGAERENFFWRRGDTLSWKKQLPGLLLADPDAHGETNGVIKSLYLEPGGLAIFRNRAYEVLFPHAEFWSRIHVAPVPDVPGEVDQDWIFANGPVFPRNDRMFRVPRGSTVSRQIVFPAEPGTVEIGLRSGSWPAVITLELGGEKRTVALPPNEQEILLVTPRRWRFSGEIHSNPGGRYIVPFTVRADFGSATVSVMTKGEESHVFKLFGGDLTERAQLKPTDSLSSELVAEMSHLRFLDGSERVDMIPQPELGIGYRFPKQGINLPCGPYLLQCEIRSLAPGSEVSLKLDDLHRCRELAVFEESYRLQEGLNVVTSRFAKAFAPYEGQLELKCLKGRCRLESWTLVPDTSRIRVDLAIWSQGGAAPAWLGRGGGTNSVPPAWAGTPITFGGNIRLTRLAFPAMIRKGVPVSIDCAMEFEKGGLADFQDYVVFIHLLDKAGHTVHQFHFQLWQAMALGRLNKPILCDAPETVPPGPYGLEVGLYDARTERRVSIQGAGLSDRERKKRNHVFGKTILEEPERIGL